MCLAIPSRVERIDGLMAVVDTAGERRTVNLMLLDDGVQVGDYVLVQNGRFAYERLDAARAREALDAIADVIAAADDRDLRSW